MEPKFLISVDTCCDNFKSDLKARDIRFLSLTLIKDGQEYKDDYDTDEQYHAFYQSIRTGALPSTSQLNQTELEEFFIENLNRQPGDILHISLSGGLSGTSANAAYAAKAVMERFPGRHIEAVDSLNATHAMEMLCNLAAIDRDNGMDVHATAAHLYEVIAHTHHIVLADDLIHFKRGGRVTATAAFLGSILHIKPMIYVSPEGRLKVIAKAPGVQRGLKFMLSYLQKYGTDIEHQTIYLSHADCVDRANEMKNLIHALYPSATVVIGWIGPIIGSHTGTGTLAMCFTGVDRNEK